MVAILEAIFRRPIRLLLFILLLPALSVAVAYFLIPRSYQASASLWALRRYVVIGATGPETDLQATPAQTQVTALSELLQSRNFALKVAKETELASTLSASARANQQNLEDALYQEISTKVLAAPSGYNLFVITYINKNPKVAQEVIQATIHNYDLQSQAFTAVEAQQLLDSYQTQLAQAKQAQDAAAQAEARYIRDNPQLTEQQLLTDPQYQLLHSQTQQAQTNVQNIQAQIAVLNQEIAQQGSGSDNLFKVLDAPSLPIHAMSRTKNYLTYGGISLGVALLACALYIVISVRRSRVVYTPLELEKVASFPVVMELPQLSPTIKSLLALPEPVDSVPGGQKIVGKK